MTADLQSIEKRLIRIESMLERLLATDAPGVPEGMSSQGARLIALARRDPEAAKIEAKRLSKLDTAINKHKEKAHKQKKQ